MAGLLEFSITPEGGEPQRVTASKLDAITVERALGQPIVSRAQEGYFEPVLRLAYAAAVRTQALPEGTSFEVFVDTYEVAMETSEDEQGN